MKFRLLFLLLIFVGVKSCEDEEPVISGQVLLSSEFNFNLSTVEGYIFESQQFVSYSPAGEIVPDILVDQYRLVDGSLKAGFTSPGNKNGFALVKSFEDFDNSMEFYNEFSEADSAMNFTASTDTVQQFQVWLFKSSNDHYAKIHVREINTISDMEGLYLSVLIDYYYQEDGTPVFP